MIFNSKNGDFTLDFIVTSLDITSPTEIYLSNLFYYPNGVEIEVIPSVAASYKINQEGNRLFVSNNLSEIKLNDFISIKG